MAAEVFTRAEKLSLTLPTYAYNNLLSLTAGLGEPGHGCQSQRLAHSPQDLPLAMRIWQRMRQLSLLPSEAAYSSLIRACCTASDSATAARAIDIYRDLTAQDTIKPKQRTFTALLHYYAQQGDELTCTQLFSEMRERFAIPATEREYQSMLRVALLTRNASLFTGTLHDLMEETLLLTLDSTLETIVEWFTQVDTSYQCVQSTVTSAGVVVSTQSPLASIDLSDSTKSDLLKQLQTFAVQRDPNFKYKPNNKVKEMVELKLAKKLSVQRESAEQQQQQQSSQQSESTPTLDERPELLEQTTDVAVSELNATDHTNSDSRSQHKKAIKSDAEFEQERQEKWNHFLQRLSSQEYDIIIDGANVGYYNQNYQGAPNHVDYLQIHQMVQYVLSIGKRPLLILHSRHIHEMALRNVHDYCVESLDERDETQIVVQRYNVQEMIAEWKEKKILYATPKSFNDDWFWMFAAVKLQLPVITNDEMRDHHFAMLSPRYFTRWRERHRVRYNLYFKYPLALKHLLPSHKVMGMDDDSDDNSDSDSDSNSDSVDSDDGPADAECDEDSQVQENEKEEKVEVVNALSSGQLIHTNRRLVHYNPAYRRVRLRWPLKYSYRMQFVQTATQEGYYIPPVLHKLPHHAPLIDNGTATEANDATKKEHEHGHSSSDQDRVMDADVTIAELIEDLPVIDPERLKLPWTCFVKHITTNNVIDSSPLAKRARDDDSADRIELSPLKMRRQITKDLL